MQNPHKPARHAKVSLDLEGGMEVASALGMRLSRGPQSKMFSCLRSVARSDFFFRKDKYLDIYEKMLIFKCHQLI